MLARGQAYISRICHIAPKIQLVIARTFLALPVNTMANPNVLSVVPTWALTHEAKVSPRTLGGRVAEEFRLVIAAAALPTVLIGYFEK